MQSRIPYLLSGAPDLTLSPNRHKTVLRNTEKEFCRKKDFGPTSVIVTRLVDRKARSTG